MYTVVDKDIIEMEIAPLLPKTKQGFPPTVPLVELVTATLEEADIATEGLFLNADAGFDSKSFSDSYAKKDINANVCFNKRNGNTHEREEYFNQELYDQRNEH